MVFYLVISVVQKQDGKTKENDEQREDDLEQRPQQLRRQDNKKGGAEHDQFAQNTTVTAC